MNSLKLFILLYISFAAKSRKTHNRKRQPRHTYRKAGLPTPKKENAGRKCDPHLLCRFDISVYSRQIRLIAIASSRNAESNNKNNVDYIEYYAEDNANESALTCRSSLKGVGILIHEIKDKTNDRKEEAENSVSGIGSVAYTGSGLGVNSTSAVYAYYCFIINFFSTFRAKHYFTSFKI